MTTRNKIGIALLLSPFVAGLVIGLTALPWPVLLLLAAVLTIIGIGIYLMET